MIKKVLLSYHGIKLEADADFTITDQSSFLETASSITAIFTIFLVCIAGISLIVGGIGIMNMMLTTVTERTKEIGLRKALGARERDINMQFLMESITLTVIGGVIGISLGIGGSLLFSFLASFATKISISSIFLAFFISALIGVVFGYYPAKKASQLNPMDALRHE
jgi:putative ABC transport system permease protein